MSTIVALFAIGIVLILLEVIVPGGVLGVLGGLALLGGIGLAFYQHGPKAGGLATAVAMACLGLSLYIEFVLLPKTAVGKKFFLRQSIDAASQPLPGDASVIGKIGEAATTMAPSGYVLLEGRRYEAMSRSGLIAKGAQVRVVGLDNFHLIVSQT